jgi:hypothetical protein
MKRIFFIIILIGFSTHGFSQVEFSTKFKSIPPKSPEPKEIPPKVDPPPVAPKPAVPKPDTLKVNPEDIFKDERFYKKSANVEGIYYRRNQFLGSFKTKTFVSTIRYRDAAFVDGDKIKVWVNDKVIQPEISLVGEFKEVKIQLTYGANKIDFEALNEGTASPNTANFEVYDDKGAVISSSQWNVGTGYKATIILIKE